MRNRFMSFTGLAAAVLLAVPVDSQHITLRVRGRVINQDGAPVSEATVKAEGQLGLRGSQFVGQRDFARQVDKSGYWALLGLVRGSWLFEASAPGYVPHVMCLPIEMMEPASTVAAPWELSMELQSLEGLIPEEETNEPWARLLREATAHFLQGRRAQAVGTAARLLEQPITAEVMCAAGDFCLLARDDEKAEEFFERAIDFNAEWYRPYLGLGTVGMFREDYDLAVSNYFKARDLTDNDDLKRTLSAAIRDLQKSPKLMKKR